MYTVLTININSKEVNMPLFTYNQDILQESEDDL